MKKKPDWQISYTLFFFTPPIDMHDVVMISTIAAFIWLKRQDRFKPFKKIEFLWMFLGALGYIFLVLFLAVTTIASIPWWQIILIGVAADVIGTALGSIPVVGDFLSAVLVIIMVVVVLHNPFVGFVVLCLGIITLLPGPTFGANTLFLILFKLLLTLFGL